MPRARRDLATSGAGANRAPNRPRLGLFLPTIEGLLGDGWAPAWSELREIARTAETIGFDALFVPDHLLMRGSRYWGIPETTTRGAWELWTTLSALAAATERVALGPFVAASSFREPALLAKAADTLDEVSGGRLVLGLGSGSHPPEYAAFGYPDDHLAGRFDEALRIAVPLLRDGRADFEGRYYRVRDCELRPRGPRPGGPGGQTVPVWIAGFGPRLIRLAARWADGFITAWHATPAALAAPFAALGAACADVGRDSATVERIVGAIVDLDGAAGSGRPALAGPPEAIAEGLRALHAAGADHVVCQLVPRHLGGVERFRPVLEALRGTDPSPNPSP